MVSRKLQRSEEGLLLAGLAMASLLAVAIIFSRELYFALEPSSFLVLRTLLELAGILVSFAVFIVNWEASKQNRDSRSLFVATGFLTVAVVCTMHALSFQGMPNFITPNTPDKEIYYWLIASLWAAGVLLIAASVRPESNAWFLDRYFLVGANLLVCLIAFALVSLLGPSLPSMYVANQGLTPLKIGAEWVAIAISLAAIVAYVRQYWIQRDEAIMMLVAALAASILAEMALTVYRSPLDLYYVVGHIYRVVAYYLVFRALLVSSVQRPHALLIVTNERLARTVAELDARNKELDALDDVAVSLSGTLKPGEILKSAIERVMAVMRASAGAIFLAEESTDRLRLTAWRGLAWSVVEECLNHAVWSPLVPSPDGEGNDTKILPPEGGVFRRLGAASTRISSLGVCVCAPILNKARLLGVIAMVGDEDRNFGPRDSDLLTAIAYQLGLAIENAQICAQTDDRLREKVQELQRAERRSRFLFEVGALFGSGGDMDEALAQVARKSVEVLGDWCAIYLMDDRERVLRLSAIYHVDDDELGSIRELLSRRPVPMGEGLVGLVGERGEPVLSARVPVEETSAEASFLAQSVEEIALLRSVAPHSRIAVPMRALGRTVGVLTAMVTHSRQPLGEEDLALAIELADRAGSAIETARLFQESQAQRQHLEGIISQMVDGVVVTDVHGKIVVVNAAAQNVLGERTEQLLGTQSRSLKDGDGRAPWAPPSSTLPVPRVLSGEVVLGESLTVSGGGRDLVFSASAGPVRNEEGEIDGAVIVLRDMTAERETERIKDEFVGTVSHELRTPITTVLGYTDILLRGLRGDLSPKQTEAMSAVRTAGQRLLALINDLLDMSRLTAGKQTLTVVPLDLPPCVERAMGSISLLAGSKRIGLVTGIPDGLPPVLADGELLQRILGNLLSNAIKFTPEGGTVTISAVSCGGSGSEQFSLLAPEACDRGAVAVMVTDTGVGIPLEHQARIWDRFQQLDSSARRMFGGTGLGLSITKGLVELHGGRVWVESDGVPGKGSTFGFTLQTAWREEG